jgi:hypothetical protein
VQGSPAQGTHVPAVVHSPPGHGVSRGFVGYSQTPPLQNPALWQGSGGTLHCTMHVPQPPLPSHTAAVLLHGVPASLGG